MMRSAIVLRLLNTVLVSVQANAVPSIEAMLAGGTTAPSAAAAAQPTIPPLVQTIPPLAQPAADLAPAPTPMPKSSAGSVLDGGAGSSTPGGVGGLLSGLLNSANSPSPAHSPSPGQHPSSAGAGWSSEAGGFNTQVHASEESRKIVAGMIEAFMHKQSLLPGEKHCLENSVSQLTGDVVGTGRDLIVGIKAMMNGGAGQAGVGHQTQKAAQGNAASAGIDGAIKLVQLVTLSTTLVKSCVQGDALAMLKETARHFVNITYLEKRFIVSGVDIVSYLAKSVEDYEEHRFREFGADIGNALRKVLLSNSTSGKALPEGVPEEEIIRKTTEGIVNGFFVPGETLEITDKADPNVDLRLDLRRCIDGNRPFFKEIFLALWHAMAQFSANKEQHGLAPTQANNANSPEWTGELMVAMLQLPSALERCDLGMKNEQMLGEAIKTLGSLQFHFHMPQQKASFQRMGDRMARGVEAWTHWHFREYGKEVGYMLREFVLLVYPQQYSVDARGRLRRQLDSSSIASKGFSAFTVVGAAFGVLVGFMAVRTMRSGWGTSSQECEDELNDDEELE